MPSQDKKLIKLTDVTMRWEGRNVFKNVDFQVDEGDFVAITGPNGGGKTTLLRIMLKLLRPTRGQVEYFHQGEPTQRLAIGYLPQKNMIDSHFPITVEQVISSGLLSHRLDRGEAERRIEEALETVGMSDRRDSIIGEISGGQLQRTLLGRALVSQPRLLVLDEPLSYLDKYFEERVYDVVSRLAESTTIVLVSHEMSRIASMANRHIIVDHAVTECQEGHHYFAVDCPCPPRGHGML